MRFDPLKSFVDVCANQKPLYDFLLVTNCDLISVSPCFLSPKTITSPEFELTMKWISVVAIQLQHSSTNYMWLTDKQLWQKWPRPKCRTTVSWNPSLFTLYYILLHYTTNQIKVLKWPKYSNITAKTQSLLTLYTVSTAFCFISEN